MKIKEITVGKTYNTGNYTSQRIELKAELDSKDKLSVIKLKLENALDALAKVSGKDYQRAKNIIDNPDDYTGHQLKWAKEFIEGTED